jgi:antitoxin HicB
MKYHFKVHKEKDGFWAEGIELPFAKTQADTEEELRANMQEVLEMFLDDHKSNQGIVIPLPQKNLKGRGIVEVTPDPKIALAFMIRRERMEAKMSQRDAADRLGIKYISQYQKLESGKTANAELGTLVKLKVVFPRLSVDQILS